MLRKRHTIALATFYALCAQSAELHRMQKGFSSRNCCTCMLTTCSVAVCVLGCVAWNTKVVGCGVACAICAPVITGGKHEIRDQGEYPQVQRMDFDFRRARRA